MSLNFILTLIIIEFCHTMIIFPFKTTENTTGEIKPNNIEYNTSHFVNDYWFQPAYTTIKIGSVPQEVKVILSYNDCGFKLENLPIVYIQKNICLIIIGICLLILFIQMIILSQ